MFSPRSRSRRTSGRTTQQAPRSGPSLPSTPVRRAAPTSPAAVTRTVSDSVHRMRVAARRLRSGLRVFRSLLDREWADELKCAGSGLGQERELEVLIARLEMRIAAVPAMIAGDPSVGAMGRTREQQAPGKGRRLVSVRSLPRVAGTAQRRRSHATHDGGGGSAGQPGAAAAVPQGLATAGEAGRSRPRERVGPARWCAGRRMAPDAEWHQVRIAAKRARYAGEAVAPVLGEEAAASPARWRRSRRSSANTRTLLTLAQRSGSSRRAQTRRPASPSACSTRPNANGLRRPAAGSRRCGPKSAAKSGADG